MDECAVESYSLYDTDVIIFTFLLISCILLSLDHIAQLDSTQQNSFVELSWVASGDVIKALGRKGGLLLQFISPGISPITAVQELLAINSLQRILGASMVCLDLIFSECWKALPWLVVVQVVTICFWERHCFSCAAFLRHCELQNYRHRSCHSHDGKQWHQHQKKLARNVPVFRTTIWYSRATTWFGSSQSRPTIYRYKQGMSLNVGLHICFARILYLKIAIPRRPCMHTPSRANEFISCELVPVNPGVFTNNHRQNWLVAVPRQTSPSVGATSPRDVMMSSLERCQVEGVRCHFCDRERTTPRTHAWRRVSGLLLVTISNLS